MIIRKAVPKSFDCCWKVFLLYLLTLRLDNTVATLAKHPILCRYCSIETPILERRHDATVTNRENEEVTFTYLFENAGILELSFQVDSQSRYGLETWRKSLFCLFVHVYANLCTVKTM